jgi:hypothetical protein
MPGSRRRRASRWTGAALAVLVCLGGALAADGPVKYEGRRLADALGVLQAMGLRIVFSSEIVTPHMRVPVEPRATRPREILDELLRPHGLAAEPGPGRILQVVRAAPPAGAEPRRKPVAEKEPGRRGADPPAYSEHVQVFAVPFDAVDRGVGAATSVGPAELPRLRGVLTGDPLRTVHAMPRVAAVDDFRNEFSVRGSPYRHIGVVVDGVATSWLQHAAYGRTGSGSVAMFDSDLVERATLQAGAYPQRHGDWLGAQLDLTLRQGSRTDTRLSGAVSGTSAAIVAEGPIGAARRGSWIASVRQSLIDWPVRRNPVDGTVFGFSDAQGKLVYDVSPRQQISVSVLAGRSGVDGLDGRPPGELANGTNHAGLVSVAWRSAPGPRLLVRQQVHVVAHEFLNKHQTGQDALRGSNRAFGYRADVMRATPLGLLEAGGQIHRTSGWRRAPAYGAPSASGLLTLESTDEFDSAAWIRSAYVNLRWTPTPRLTVTPGVRVADSTLLDRRAVGRWILAEWSLPGDWTLDASAGVSHQFPDLDRMRYAGPETHPRPERAAHAELALGRPVSDSIRWQAGLFTRRERDLLPDPVHLPAATALEASSAGFEALVERRAATGLSGWAAYSYGKTRYTDTTRQQSFWGSFDQRHALNVQASYAFSNRASAAVTFRTGTNFPDPAHAAARGDRGLAGPAGNDLRLPAYARLDVRAQRRFDVGARRLTLFAEVLNVLNRTNLGPANGLARPEPLLPRLPSAGIRVDF